MDSEHSSPTKHAATEFKSKRFVSSNLPSLRISLSLKIEPLDEIRLPDPDVPAQPDKRNAPSLDQVIDLAFGDLEVFGHLSDCEDRIL
jgi:hypothetical protein